MESEARRTRVAKGFSIDEVSAKIGITSGYLSLIETGQRHISATHAEQLAKLYRVSIKKLFVPTRFAIREVREKNAATT